MLKKVSVIVPVYNTSEFIEDCISSITHQSHTNLEIIIVNDGSTDGSEDKIEQLKKHDSRIEVYHLDGNYGVGHARNFGVFKASGEYIYFLDSDDVVSHNAIELLLKNLNHHDFILGNIIAAHYMNNKEHDESRTETLKEITQEEFLMRRSVSNLLISKDFILHYGLSFSEETQLFSEYSFVIPLSLNASSFPFVSESVYYSRERNDPISNPSLFQKEHIVVSDFLSIYANFKHLYKNEQIVRNVLDSAFLQLYSSVFSAFFAHDPDSENLFHQLVDCTSLLERKNLVGTPILLRREVKVISNGIIKSYRSVLSQHNCLRKAKQMFSGRTKFYLQLHRSVFNRLPMKKNLIVFESFLGKNYSDSPKNIYEYIQEHNLNYECVWIFNEPGKKIVGNAKQVKRFSLGYYYYLSRAKYWVSNSRLPKTLVKREGNVYLQTWHGTPLKKLVFDMKDVYSANPNYKKDFYHQSRRWDYLIAANQYSSDIFKSAFKFDKEMLDYGYPRNDILHQKNNPNDIHSYKVQLGLPKDKKVILYAPTWRDDEYHSSGKYKFKIQMDLERMKESLGDEYIVLLRMHYFISDNMDVSPYKGFVYDFSKYDDIAHLYLVSDILITDYSSVFFDYANTKRPILFFTYDLEKYRDTLRGFYLDFENDAPGPLVKTTDEIIDSIQNIESVKVAYHAKYDSFYEKFCRWEDGNATERVVKRIFK